MTVSPPIVGTETYVSFAEANALAADRLNAGEWRAAVAAYEAMVAAVPEGDDPLPALGTAIPEECRQALTTAAATLSRMPWSIDLALPSAAIPEPLATACAELAFYLLTPDSRRPRDVQTQMIGQSMDTYFPEVVDELPRHVRRLVEPFLRVRSAHCAEMIP